MLLTRIAPGLILSGIILSATTGAAATDPGRKACIADAKILCAAEMKTMSRKKVEACLIAKFDQTSPICHAAMLRIKTQRGV